MYTIGQVSEMFHIPISTLRYYDKVGLFPHIQRSSGFRRFGEGELEALRVIECLKKSGMEIRDIRQFMQWCTEGPSSYQQRYDMFLRQKETVEAELRHMEKVLDMIRFKCWYYETALRQGSEENLTNLNWEAMPEEIRKAFENAHTQS